MKKRNVYLDVIRGIACILIMFIHRLFPDTVGQVISAIARAGVAIFFIISGYYTYNADTGTMLKRMPHKIKHTLMILLYALLFYLIWESFIRWFGTGVSSTYGWITNHVLSPYTWYYALIWDRDPLAGHLWFLFALLRCYLLFVIILKCRLEKYALVFSIICLSGTLILQKAAVDIGYFRNGWLYGMGFFLAGYCIASYIRLNKTIIFFLIPLGLLLSIIGGVLYPGNQIYAGTVILALSVFCWAENKSDKSTKGPMINILASIGAKYGTLIYIVHWSIKECLIKLDKMFTFTQQEWYRWVSPLLLAVISILVCVVLYYLLTQLSNFVRVKNDK